MATVLLVEDDDALREIYADALEITGHRVVGCADGAAAWSMLAKMEQPALVVLDLLMPILNGRELLRLMRREPRFARIPVVVVTASGEYRVPDADLVVPKPTQIERFLQVVARWLQPPAA